MHATYNLLRPRCCQLPAIRRRPLLQHLCCSDIYRALWIFFFHLPRIMAADFFVAGSGDGSATYNVSLYAPAVAGSVAVCFLGAYVSLQLASVVLNLRFGSPAMRKLMLACSALLFTTVALFSMHFAGMLAVEFHPAFTYSFDCMLTLFTLLSVTIFGSLGVYIALVCKERYVQLLESQTKEYESRVIKKAEELGEDQAEDMTSPRAPFWKETSSVETPFAGTHGATAAQFSSTSSPASSVAGACEIPLLIGSMSDIPDGVEQIPGGAVANTAKPTPAAQRSATVTPFETATSNRAGILAACRSFSSEESLGAETESPPSPDAATSMSHPAVLVRRISKAFQAPVTLDLEATDVPLAAYSKNLRGRVPLSRPDSLQHIPVLSLPSSVGAAAPSSPFSCSVSARLNGRRALKSPSHAVYEKQDGDDLHGAMSVSAIVARRCGQFCAWIKTNWHMSLLEFVAAVALLAVGAVLMHHMGMMSFVGPVRMQERLDVFIFPLLLGAAVVVAGVCIMHLCPTGVFHLLAACVVAIGVPAFHYGSNAAMIFVVAPQSSTVFQVPAMDVSSMLLVVVSLAIAACIVVQIVLSIAITSANQRANASLKQMELQRRLADQLMNQILPPVVAERMRRGERYHADHDDVTAIFIDIVAFSAAASNVTSKELTDHLHRFYVRLEALAKKHQVTKIKGIGDCLLLVCGAPVDFVDHAERSVHFAVDVLRIARHRTFCGAPLRLRIGMATGPATSAVLGRDKFAYDLFGSSSLNLASRMESLGKPNAIQISEDMYLKIHGKSAYAPLFERRQGVQVKGFGTMSTWILDGDSKLRMGRAVAGGAADTTYDFAVPGSTAVVAMRPCSASDNDNGSGSVVDDAGAEETSPGENSGAARKTAAATAVFEGGMSSPLFNGAGIGYVLDVESADSSEPECEQFPPDMFV